MKSTSNSLLLAALHAFFSSKVFVINGESHYRFVHVDIAPLLGFRFRLISCIGDSSVELYYSYSEVMDLLCAGESFFEVDTITETTKII